MMENEMTLTNQRDFLVLLAVYVNQDNCSREAIVTYIYDEGWIVLSADELSKRTKDNKKYKNFCCPVTKRILIHRVLIIKRRLVIFSLRKRNGRHT